MSETQKVIEIEILRYLPESDQAPHSEVYKVPFTDDMSVLQGAQYIKDNFDGSLTFRWSCRMAICGSCGMMINGIPKLSCETFLRDYYPNRITIEALANFPIEKDLVVDLSGFIESSKASSRTSFRRSRARWRRVSTSSRRHSSPSTFSTRPVSTARCATPPAHKSV